MNDEQDSGLKLLATTSPRDKLQRYLGTYLLASGAYEIARRWYSLATSKFTYTVSIPSEEDIYPEIHKWVLDRMDSKKRKALTMRSFRDRVDSEWKSQMLLFYDGSKMQTIQVGQHKVQVLVEKEGTSTSSTTAGGLAYDDSGGTFRMGKAKEKIILSTTSIKARDAVLEILDDLAKAKHEVQDRDPDFKMATRWGDWRSFTGIPRRDMKTVVLRAGQKEALVADFQQFLASEDRYVALGIPYHRGYLLHGPAGTGKSSIAKALAAEFELDIHYIPLSDLDADASLMSLISAAPSRSILLLEIKELVS